jgi:uncharacterized membrane protein
LLILKREDEGGNRILSSLLQISIIGFLIEVIGVNSSWIFGKFAYGKSFGPLVMDTPVMIGLVWALFSFAAVQTSELFIKNKWLGSFFAALLITGLNWLMEPNAAKLGFWVWGEQGAGAGYHDYLGCFVQSWIFSFWLYHRIKDVGNVVGLSFLLFQAIFFIILRSLL